MEEIEPINHVDLAISRLLSQYQNSPNLKDFISALTIQSQELENSLFDLIESRDVDAANDESLNILGRVVGAERTVAGVLLNDVTYIKFIKIKVLRTYWDSTPDKLIRLLKFAYDNASINIVESVACYLVIIGKPLTQFEIDVLTAVDSRGFRIIPKTLGVCVSYGWYDPDNVFSFFDDPDPAALGFGEEGFPVVGGAWAELVS